MRLFCRFVLFSLVFTALFLPTLAAQEALPAVEEEIVVTESPLVETEHHGPPPSTFVKLIQFMTEADMQGKTLFIHTIKDGPNSEGSIPFIGMTEAQQLHIEAKNDEIEKRFNEMDELDPSISNWNNLSPEELEAKENKLLAVFSQGLDDMDTRIRETLTPIQLQNAREYQLANPSLMGMPVENMLNFDAYNALKLSEEQQKQLKEIQEETETEYKKAFEKLKSDPEIAENPDKLFDILNSEKMKAFTKKTKEKIQKILTPEQRERLTQIKEDVPKKIAEIKAKKAKEPKEDESWKDSWKPGDPLPEGAVPPRRAPRFPMGR